MFECRSTRPRWTWLSVLVFGLAIALSQGSFASAGEGEIAIKEYPKAVQATLKLLSSKGRLVEVEKKVTDQKDAIYEVEMIVDGRELDVLIRENGKIISKESDRAVTKKEGNRKEAGEDDDKKEKHEKENEREVEVTMSQLPKAVRKTLKRETRGGEIEELKREIESGRVVFSADVEYETDSGELVYEVEIDENGTLLCKALDEDDDEGDDDDNDDDDDDDDE